MKHFQITHRHTNAYSPSINYNLTVVVLFVLILVVKKNILKPLSKTYIAGHVRSQL